MEQELEAYTVQLGMFRGSSSRFKEAKERLAMDLAGPYYDLGITYQDAENKLRRHERISYEALAKARSAAGQAA
jgi:hypothetical protein